MSDISADPELQALRALSAAELAVVGQLGPDAVVNARTEPVRERILDLTGRRAGVFRDPGGGQLFDITLRAIAHGRNWLRSPRPT
jgi:NADPH:quinone reductase-like Zn-dependent oxidoreductase